MSSFVQQASKSTVGSISVSYPEFQNSQEFLLPENDFDEDEQLYNAVDTQALIRKYPNIEIPLYKIDEQEALAMVVPHFANSIAERYVAKQIALLSKQLTQWLILSPCQINNNISICRLDLSSRMFTDVPILQPPHFITGICASLLSELMKLNVDPANIGALVLNSEGQPGFEKIDADALMEAAEKSASFLVGEQSKQKFLKTLSLTVRKINSAVTSGMYI